MRNFTDKALIIMTPPENYENKTYTYKARTRMSVERLIDYLHKIGTQPDMLCTDEVALMLYPSKVRWIRTLVEGDLFFMKNHNETMKRINSEVLVDEYNLPLKISKKVELKPKLNPEERFSIVAKREELVVKELIKNYKAIFVFKQGNIMLHRVLPKEADNKIICHINSKDFLVQTYISGQQVNPNDLLNFAGANRAMYEWEVDKWL